ncbi:MAG TPA: hypothetical protein VFH48_38250 [Chloroflexota bacterium]|nr:hypothetical protein [Chloroflexota bacterium]
MPPNDAAPTADPSLVVLDEPAIALAVEHLLDLIEATWRDIEAANGARSAKAA